MTELGLVTRVSPPSNSLDRQRGSDAEHRGVKKEQRSLGSRPSPKGWRRRDHRHHRHLECEHAGSEAQARGERPPRQNWLEAHEEHPEARAVQPAKQVAESDLGWRQHDASEPSPGQASADTGGRVHRQALPEDGRLDALEYR